MQTYLLSRKYFKLAFIIYAFINTLALGYLGFNLNILLFIMIGWGGLIIGWDFYQKQINYHDIKFILIITYGLILFLATAINPYSNLKSYLIALLQLMIFFLIYGNQKSFSSNNIYDELKSIIPLTNLLTGLAGICSLIMYLFKFSKIQNGWPIGLVGNRLFGVYFNCNPAAFLSAITILLSLNALKNEYTHPRLYKLNITVQLLYIILTQCRAALVILAVILTGLIYTYFFKDCYYSKLKKYLFSLGLSIIIFITSIITANGLSYLSGNHHETSSRFQINKVIESIELFFQGDFQPSLDQINQISSGRIELFNTSIEIWQTNPILGIGAGNFQTIGRHLTNSNVVKQIQVVHSHNVFLETLVTTGIAGASLFIIFFIASFKSILKLFKVKQQSSNYLKIMIFTLIVVSEFIGGMFDYGVFYVYSLSATLCWLFLGYLHDYH